MILKVFYQIIDKNLDFNLFKRMANSYSKSLKSISKFLIIFITSQPCLSKAVLYDDNTDSYWEVAPNQDFDHANNIPIGKNIRGKTNPYVKGHALRLDIFSFSTDNDILAEVLIAQGQNYNLTNLVSLSIGSSKTGSVITTIWSGNGFQADKVALTKGDYFVLVYCNSNSVGAYDYRFRIDFPQSSDSVSGPVSSAKLDSWTWNGAFPWVYNNATDSWFYYAFSGNSYNAYDARNRSWFTFDSDTGKWNPYN